MTCVLYSLDFGMEKVMAHNRVKESCSDQAVYYLVTNRIAGGRTSPVRQLLSLHVS